MRKSTKRVLADPTLSDAHKIEILKGEIELLEKLLTAARDSREYLYNSLIRAVDVMDEETARRYEQTL